MTAYAVPRRGDEAQAHVNGPNGALQPEAVLTHGADIWPTPTVSHPDTCDRCGAVVSIADWPFCPHAPARGLKYFEDAIPGGMVVENGFDTPQTFYSHSDHRAALAARGLEIHAKWAGPNDQHLSRMDIPCATTLENARILLTRGVRVEAPEVPIPITVTPMTFERTTCC